MMPVSEVIQMKAQPPSWHSETPDHLDKSRWSESR